MLWVFFVMILGDIQRGLTVTSTASLTDIVLGVVSLTPILPFVIFVPRLLRKIKVRYNYSWAHKWYKFENHKSYITALYGWEIF